ncbi:Arginine/serine-rich coiled-coil protein 2 [Trachymyrmex zeteki]|uniref:Arginine/serine-rich coiled-coil protein 2 n=1 Tax=Mycetomoellerius zeteki TaxID=64791 RepID=A0A151X3Y9_9HYME|nr:PREDICTED: arginine/serine-rich coiled-coil protein 2 isoform X1 [Trachymyrmex zeteki]KYQ54990.1 Arginine/serine-rich coiled-coil protein 2 [Trachymyrmex zeteki]
MDSLANYASDGDNSNNSDTKTPPQGQEEANRRASDANYDPVQMDMSEESNNNNSSRESSSERANSPTTAQSTFGSRTESSRALPSPSDQRRGDHENHTSSKDDHRRGDRSDRSRHSSDKSRRYDDRRQRDNNHRDRSRDRRNRDDDKRKTSLGSSKDEKSDDRERSDKDHHYRDDRRDRGGNRDRNDRDRRRDRSDRNERDRRHSRDDRSKDRYRDERSSYHKERDRTRSRSRSRDRAPSLPFRTMSYREEKGRNKLAQLEKLGIELKPPEGGDTVMLGGVQGEQSYYNPLATATQGKYAEQIQKRKLLWANKSKQDDGNSTSTAASTANTWMGTTFTHDQDGKVTAKFKRLMGIKGDLPNAPAVGAKPDILKKQEEMFNNMEQQYEVARATTHTQRGVGLGYATGGYQFPR